MPDTKDAPKADTQLTPEELAARPYIWISADHVQDIHELHQIMVAVDPNSGAVLDPQPDYPEPEEEPPPPPENPAATKAEESRDRKS